MTRGWPATDAECSRWTFALHESALRALGLLAAAGGSEVAFFTLPGEPPANAAIVAYVEESVPAHGGEHYTPHLLAGVAPGSPAFSSAVRHCPRPASSPAWISWPEPMSPTSTHQPGTRSSKWRTPRARSWGTAGCVWP